MTISTAAECGRELCYGCKAPFKGECNQECPENLAGAGACMSACACARVQACLCTCVCACREGDLSSPHQGDGVNGTR